MANTSKTLVRNIIIAALFFLMAVLVLVSFYFRNLSPDALDSIRFLHEMPVERIQEVRIEPYPVKSLAEHTIILKDRKQIGRLADALRTAQPFAPIHPGSRWMATVRIKVTDREYHGIISSTEDGQGVLFHYFSATSGRWNYGCYRQDSLGPLLEEFAKNL